MRTTTLSVRFLWRASELRHSGLGGERLHAGVRVLQQKALYSGMHIRSVPPG